MGALILLGFVLMFLTVLGVANAWAKAGEGEREISAQRRRRSIAWLTALMVLGGVMNWFSNWVVESFSDILIWTYISGVIGVFAFATLNYLIIKLHPPCRGGYIILLRFFMAVL